MKAQGATANPNGKVGEHVDDPIHHERQKALEPLRHRHAVVRVLQVDGAPPKTQRETRSDRPYRLHLEPWNKEKLVESMEVDDEAEGVTFLWHQKNPGKERLREKNLANPGNRQQGGAGIGTGDEGHWT